MRNSCLIAMRQRLAFLSILLLAGFSMSASCRDDNDRKNEMQPLVVFEQKAAKPSPSVAVKITKIDGKPLKKGVMPEVGHKVDVEGTISDSKTIACMLVHPMNGNTWWVQNNPGLPNQADKVWSISGQVFCGTDKLGKGEKFEIVILTESSRSYCEPGKKFEASEFPNNLPRSESITVKRARD